MSQPRTNRLLIGGGIAAAVLLAIVATQFYGSFKKHGLESRAVIHIATATSRLQEGIALPLEAEDHTGSNPSIPVTDADGQPDVETGAYLVRVIGCRDCHGEDLTGGKSPEPGAPYAPHLTYSGVGGTWSAETFIAAARTMSGRGMPWMMLKPLDDSQMQATMNYLHSLPGK